MNLKRNLKIMVPVLLLVLISIPIIYLQGEGGHSLTGAAVGSIVNKFADYRVNDDGFILLDQEGTISADLSKEHGLEDQIIVLESKYCGACQAALPLIKEAASETGATVTYIDLAENEGQAQVNQLKILPYYTPTMVVGGQVYIGGKTKEEYYRIFSDFLKKQG